LGTTALDQPTNRCVKLRGQVILNFSALRWWYRFWFQFRKCTNICTLCADWVARSTICKFVETTCV